MLVRSGAARQSLRTRHLLASGPPRLCLPSPVAGPAAAVGASRVLTTATDSRAWKKKSFRALVGFERNLATALEEHRFGQDIPFEGMRMDMASQYRPQETQSPPLYTLRPFNVNDALVIRAAPPAPSTGIRINSAGIPGDVEEMLSVFEACIRVSRLDRAALVLKRFEYMKNLDSYRLIALHNRYLEARVAQLEAEPREDKAEELHKWFEVYIRAAQLPLTPLTIAYMLKTTLLIPDDKKLARRVDRYMSMMPQQDAAAEAMDLGNVLSDEDLALIAKTCPKYSVPEAAAGEAELGARDEARDADVAADQNVETPPFGSSEVLSTPQKGMGLRALKTTLSMFSELPDNLDISHLPHSQRLEIQAKLERDSVDAAIARWRDENQTLMNMGLNTQLSTPSLNSKLYEWHKALEARLAEEQAKVEQSELAVRKSQEDLDRCLYGPHMLQSPPHRLAAVTILSALSSLSMHGADRGVPVSNMVQQLAKIAEEDIRAQELAKTLPKSKRRQQGARQVMRYRGLSPRPDEVNDPSAGTAQRPQNANPAGPVPVVPQPEDPDATGSLEARWPMAIRTKFGAVLLAALIDTAKIVVEAVHPETGEKVRQAQPAFTHGGQYRRGRKIGTVQPNRTLVELMKREPRGEALARHLPMVVEPLPWTKFDKGAFLTSPSALVRLKNHEKDQRIYAEAAIERGDMEQMMRGLDVLGKTAWRINRPVFDVMLAAWNTGEEFANLPAVDPKVPTPPEPDSTDDPMKRRLWLRALKAAENERSGLHSVRCFMNFQLEIARAFRDQTFYFPHNVDFRGRAYPLPTYLNHMGADHMRGLLIFAKGKPLGERGLQWLKVHLANVYGFDKASLQEREEFAAKNMDNIIDAAENPLTGKRWWLKAEDPWQCLATCIELKAALSHPNPAEYVSHLPVHQDGTCNGLQHYAALGGDTWGAQQVNLLPNERPADVYSAVAELVQEHVSKDIAAGHELPRAVDGKITRKVVKQTVMTNVYGVTFVGAKKQVLKQLDSLYPDLEKETGYSATILASYIASKIFVALSTMFSGAHDIQHWLGEIGGRVCRAMTPEQLDRFAEAAGDVKKKTKKSTDEEMATQFRNTLVWTTPLRMPVVQPYRKNGTRLISTCLQDLLLTTMDRDDPVNRRKQLQAFPPNFIHSLDASHMMLSALECNEMGLTFAAVHDSFWTHAADVDVMNRVIRDSFIRIHQEDVIGRLKSEFEARYRGSLYRAKIASDTEVGKQIMAHRRKTRLSAEEELLEERRRQQLLNSMDPEEVMQGREMVTPASIFESMATPDMVKNVVEPGELSPMARDEDGEIDADAGPSASSEAAIGNEADEAAATNTASESIGQTLDKVHGTNFFVQEWNKSNRLRESPKARVNDISVWLPLTFPEIPKKGSFDVTKLKESKYFFS